MPRASPQGAALPRSSDGQRCLRCCMSTLRSDAFRVQRMCAHCPAVCACVKYIACIFHCICMCETGCETFRQSGSDFLFPRGVHAFMCALTCDVCPCVYIFIAFPLGGEAGPWVCTSLHTLGSIAYTYACLLPALLRAAAFTCARALLSYPPSRMHPTH